MDFSRVILEFRAKHDLTQEQMAEMLEVCPNTIHRYEANKNKPTAAKKIRFENKMKEWEMVKK